MPDIKYIMFFDNNPATRDQLDRIEDITVEQEVDMAWEARIEVPICVDDKGRWTGEDEAFMKSFSRIRIEVGIGKTFVPLIDGPVVGKGSNMSFEPGKSSITLIVRDDSVYLDREDKFLFYKNKQDHQIAEQIFEEYKPIITSIDVEQAPTTESSLEPIVQVSTHMQLLRSLAKRRGWHAYVLPGDKPGESIGVFKPFPKTTDEHPPLPELVSLGPDRNVKPINITEKLLNPSIAMTSTIRIKDKKIISRTASFRDREILGDKAVLEKGMEPAVHILPPYCKSVDPDTATSAEADKSSYAIEATGSILEGCYSGVLQPYCLVKVRMGDTPLSGYYVITRVTHRLTRSIYSQSFSLKRDAKSERSKDSSKNKESFKNLMRSIH